MFQFSTKESCRKKEKKKKRQRHRFVERIGTFCPHSAFINAHSHESCVSRLQAAVVALHILMFLFIYFSLLNAAKEKKIKNHDTVKEEKARERHAHTK